MGERSLFVLAHETARQRAQNAIRQAPEGWEVLLKPATRNSAQNARLWAQLGDIARQVVWHGKKLSPEDWKAIFTASLKRMEVVPNLDGTGFVALGTSTSVMSKREMADLIDLMTAFGNEREVEWSEPEMAA